MEDSDEFADAFDSQQPTSNPKQVKQSPSFGSEKKLPQDPVISKLMISLRVTKPIAKEEMSLIDKFIKKYQGEYHFSTPTFKTLMIKNLEQRILQNDSIDSFDHMLRVFSLARLLSRDKNLMQLFIEMGGPKVINYKLRQLQSMKKDEKNETHIVLLIELIAILKRIFAESGQKVVL